MNVALPARPPRGFALISVLALVSLAALTATAFLASARLDRQATLSLGNRTQLELALDAGQMCVVQTVNDYTQPDVGGNTHIVTYWRTNWSDELGYPFIAKIKTSGKKFGSNSAAWYYAPLFSPAGVTNLDTNSIQNAMRFTNLHQGTFSSDMSNFMAVATNGFSTNTASSNSTTIPLLGGRTSPPVGWVYIEQEKRKPGTTLTNTSPVIRFAWFTEDLDGLIDAERMGSSPQRTTGTNPAEVSLNDAMTNGTTLVTSVADFTNRAAQYLSPALLANRAVSGLRSTNDVRYFASGLRSWSPTPPAGTDGALAWIPAGIPVTGTSDSPKGYANQGYTKINLNRLTTANDIPVIVTAITNNLPGFTNRAGAMDGGAYLSNIAANIVDYIDADSDPNVASVTGTNLPAWRGVEAIPWPNEIFTLFYFETDDTKAADGGFQYSFKYKHYLEVWNIANRELPLVNMVISNNRSFLVRIPPVTFNLNDTNLGAVTLLTLTPVGSSPASLKPGEFGMLETPTQTLRYGDTSTNVAQNVQFQDWNQNASVIYTTNRKVVSATPGGQLIYNKDIVADNLYGVPAGVNFATALSYACQKNYRNGPPNLKSVGGDPRAQLFLGTWPTKGQLYVDYSSPGGLNWESGNKKYSNSYVNAAALWADGGHYLSADLGENPTTYGTSPETLYNKRKGSWSTNIALSRVNNTGALTNICELGSIYDPMQWEDSTQLPPAADSMPGLWTNLSTSATPSDRAGGRTSLRIGRPEFTRFAFTNFGGNSTPWIPNMGMSAVALLDLFCITNGTSISGGPFSTGGKINLNTAPAPVLRALAGGVVLSNDPSMLPANTKISPAMAEAFAQGVMRFRFRYPFLTPSHLNFIGTDENWPNTTNWPANAVFGNTNAIALSAAPGNSFGTSVSNTITAWNDLACEEWFSKIWGLSSCQSYNFRVYVVAQRVDSNKVPVGPIMRKYFQLYSRNNSSVDQQGTNTYGSSSIVNWIPAMTVMKTYESPY